MQIHEYDTLRILEDRYWWYQILHELVSRELALRLPAKARVLDAGCGTGGMLEVLRKQHPQWVVEGIDANGGAVRHCHERGLGNVQLGDVGRLPYATGSFDAVLSLDVLYHADVDETRTLPEMTRVLKREGVLVLNLPAFDCLRGSHDLAVCGARRYNACQVRQMLENRNLSIEMIHYWNAWLFLPLLIWRRLSRLTAKTGTATASDLNMPPPWLNRLLTGVGRIDAQMCRSWRLPLGSSVFALAVNNSTGD
jgi:SAM-dependent methyltransferase